MHFLSIGWCCLTGLEGPHGAGTQSFEKGAAGWHWCLKENDGTGSGSVKSETWGQLLLINIPYQGEEMMLQGSCQEQKKNKEKDLFSLLRLAVFLCCPWLAVAEGLNSKGEMWFAGSQPQLHTAEYRKMSWYYEAHSFITDTTHIHWPSGRVSGTRDTPLNQRLCPHTASSLVRPGRP